MNRAKIETIALADLSPDPGNLRTHDERSIGSIAASLRQFGGGRSIVLDRTNVVRAGNGTLEAAARSGITEVLIVEPGPGQIVAVKRSDWTEEEASQYAIADNRIQELADWDRTGLAEALRGFESDPGFDLAAIGFTDNEVAALVEGLGSSHLFDSADRADRGDVAPVSDPGASEPPGLSTPTDGPQPVKRYTVVVSCASEQAAQRTAAKLKALGYRAETATALEAPARARNAQPRDRNGYGRFASKPKTKAK